MSSFPHGPYGRGEFLKQYKHLGQIIDLEACTLGKQKPNLIGTLPKKSTFEELGVCYSPCKCQLLLAFVQKLRLQGNQKSSLIGILPIVSAGRAFHVSAYVGGKVTIF